jgi:hypothetical protein
VDQLLTRGPHEECSINIDVGGVGQLHALIGEASNVLTEGLIRLLPTTLEVLGVAWAHVSALEVPHKNFLEVFLIVDASGQKVF